MEILFRKGSEVVLRDKKGRIWLTRRIKIRKTSKRRKPDSYFRTVRYIPIKQIIEINHLYEDVKRKS